MSNLTLTPQTNVYTFNYDADEEDLCKLEVSALFDATLDTFVLESTRNIDSSRSPFIKEKIEVLFKEDTLEELLTSIQREMPPFGETYKVIGMTYRDIAQQDKLGYRESKEIAKQVASVVPGKATLHHPEVVFAIIKRKGKWFFGSYSENKSIWLKHKQKPHNYSTALNTRVARALVNIAVPEIKNVKVIDPCCGIGTVVIEALSIGVDIRGSDINPLVMTGIRENLAHFGYTAPVSLKDMRDITEMFDVAIIDMPYNLCSVVSDQEKLEMLQAARRFTKKMVIVTTEMIDGILDRVGFEIINRCEVAKGKFIRQVIVCV